MSSIKLNESNESNESFVSLQENYSCGANCVRCALLSYKCKKYKKMLKSCIKMINTYKKRESNLGLRMLLFVMLCYLVYYIYYSNMNKTE